MFQKAADWGNPAGQTNLGLMLANGDGIAKDVVQAYALFNHAAADNFKRAKEFRDALAKEMTPVQIRKAQMLQL